jgi:hypothetical protein
MSEKLTTYLVTIVEPYEGLGLQQDPLECTSEYIVRITNKQRKGLFDQLQELWIENTEDYKYDYDHHYGVIAFRIQKENKLRGLNQYPALQKFLKWRTPKSNGPKGMLASKGQNDDE